MMPFNQSFRRLLTKYIPRLPQQEIDKHESLLSQRNQIQIEKKYIMIPASLNKKDLKFYSDELQKRINIATDDAKNIFNPYKRSYNAAYKLWITRREFALEQGSFLQIPPTFSRLVRFTRKAFKYQWIRIESGSILWGCRLIQLLSRRKPIQDDVADEPKQQKPKKRQTVSKKQKNEKKQK